MFNVMLSLLPDDPGQGYKGVFRNTFWAGHYSEGQKVLSCLKGGGGSVVGLKGVKRVLPN